MPTQGASITVQGGLDLVSSSHALFKTPGAATVLQNFESSTTGGYRRISGFEKLGGDSAVIPSGLIQILFMVFRIMQWSCSSSRC